MLSLTQHLLLCFLQVQTYTKHALKPVNDPLDASYKLFSSLDLPENIYDAACGGGCPLSFAQNLEGKEVIDLGCGAGHDVIIAAKMGAAHVVGMDVTKAMLDRAAESADQAGVSDRVEFIEASFDEFNGTEMPGGLREGSADVVISNGAINLAFDKPAAFRAAFRLAAPGGQFCLTDVVVDTEAQTDPENTGLQVVTQEAARWSN